MTAWQHLSVGTLQGLAFWVLISKVSSHSKNSKAILAQRGGGGGGNPEGALFWMI